MFLFIVSTSTVERFGFGGFGMGSDSSNHLGLSGYTFQMEVLGTGAGGTSFVTASTNSLNCVEVQDVYSPEVCFIPMSFQDLGCFLQDRSSLWLVNTQVNKEQSAGQVTCPFIN